MLLWYSTPLDFVLPVGNFVENPLGVVGVVLFDSIQVLDGLGEEFER